MKKSKVCVIVLISIFTLGLIITSIYFAYKSNETNPNMYTIISGWISGIATLIIGILTVWLNFKIDKESKRKDAIRDKEVKEQYVNQLKLNASPIIFFESIENFSLSNGIIMSDNEFVNRLLDKKPNKKIISANAGFSFELVFKSPKVENVENIYIESCELYIKSDNNFGNKYSCRFDNYSSNKSANLKYKDNGSLICHTDLLFLEENETTIYEYIKSIIGKKNEIVFMMNLIASNSLGLSKTYRCSFYFKLINEELTEFDGVNYKLEIVNNVMWAEEVKVIPKTYEINK